MEVRPYGSTGLTVSSLAYGAMSIALDPDIRGGVAPSLLEALEQGITIIDTARGYPNSEMLIGATLREWRGQRPTISTKLAPLSRETFRRYQPLATAYTPLSIRQSVETSLRTLGVDVLDIVHLHQWHYRWTHEAPWLETLHELRKEGKLRFIAVSAQDHEHDALLEAVSRGMIDGAQLIINLFESHPMDSFLPFAQLRGVGVIARCVLDSGGLSGTLAPQDFAARTFLKHAPVDEYLGRLGVLQRRFIPEFAHTLPELALRFVLSAPQVSSITLGMQGANFVKDAVRVFAKGPLPSSAVEAICREHIWTKNFYERL